MFCFIKDNTEKESVIVFWKPRMMTLMTGRKSFQTSKLDKIFVGDYLCLYLRKDSYNQPPASDLEFLLNNYELQMVYENPDFRIYKAPHSQSSKLY